MVVGSQGEGRKADGKAGNEGYERRDGGGNIFSEATRKYQRSSCHILSHIFQDVQILTKFVRTVKIIKSH